MSSIIEKLINGSREDTISVTLSVGESVVFKFAKGYYDNLDIVKNTTNVADALKILLSKLSYNISGCGVYNIVCKVYDAWVVDSDKSKFLQELFLIYYDKEYTVSKEKVICGMLSYIRLLVMHDAEKKYRIKFNESDPWLQYANSKITL